MAALTALQALRDQGHVQPGQRVLINGAAGGVGTFAVQIAKALGAEVTGVCSSGNIGHGRVDRRQPGHRLHQAGLHSRTGKRYDLLVDIAGNRPFTASGAYSPGEAALVAIGAPDKGRVLGPVTRAVKALLISPLVPQKVTFFLSQPDIDDLAAVRDLLSTGKVTPVIDRTYPLGQAAEAIAYLEHGHARGKVVVTV